MSFKHKPKKKTMFMLPSTSRQFKISALSSVLVKMSFLPLSCHWSPVQAVLWKQVCCWSSLKIFSQSLALLAFCNDSYQNEELTLHIRNPGISRECLAQRRWSPACGNCWGFYPPEDRLSKQLLNFCSSMKYVTVMLCYMFSTHCKVDLHK